MIPVLPKSWCRMSPAVYHDMPMITDHMNVSRSIVLYLAGVYLDAVEVSGSSQQL